MKKLFPNTDAVGQHIRYTQAPRDGSPNDFEVVGVVGTHRHDVQNDTMLRRMFVPWPWPRAEMLICTFGSRGKTVAPSRR